MKEGYFLKTLSIVPRLCVKESYGDLRGVAGGDGELGCLRQAPVICVMAPPIHLGAWSMALMVWLPFENHVQCCTHIL